jgi:hypothetical protein
MENKDRITKFNAEVSDLKCNEQLIAILEFTKTLEIHPRYASIEQLMRWYKESN